MQFLPGTRGPAYGVTWDEVITMFHEFGHALHGILSNCRYNSLSGTNSSSRFRRDGSQFNESFSSILEVFDNYAKGCQWHCRCQQH